ncbi:MAG: 50S ribosomal protein L6 [Nanoarchaeota archaeon]|nr:50S ribosomal protein L6 [Nanoarchaeota archaeon]
MKREIIQKIEVPENVKISIEGNMVSARGPEGENKKKFNFSGLDVRIEGNRITLECKKATKKEKKMINTAMAHLRNMIEGVSKKFEYLLKICYSHFPITAEVKGNELVIKNFLGERTNRKCRIPQGAEVKVDKEIITVISSDREIAGQAAANIEQATKIRKRDLRVFQDGIFMINKAGKEI